MSQVKYAAILLGLALCSSARADQTPVTFSYDGDTIQTYLVYDTRNTPTGTVTYYDDEAINVSFFFYDSNAATPPGWFSVMDGHDLYQVDPIPVVWKDTPSPGMYLAYPYPLTVPDPPADPPAATPEPGTLLLFVAGLVVAWLALLRPRKPTNRQRYDAFCSHPFRKG